MGLPNLTPEEEYLLKKFAALKRKKKDLQKAKEKAESPVVVKPGSKRDVPVDSSHAPEDAKEIAKKLIASGEVKIKKDPVHREFKRAKGGERKIIKDFQQQPSSSSRNEQQSRAAAMKNLYDSFVPSSAAQNRRFSGGQGSRGSWSEEPKKGNTIFVNGIGLTEKILQESFTQFGKVQRVNFEKEKGQGLVTFDSCEAAENAISEMNGNMVSGVIIKVRLSRKQPNMGDSNFRPRPGLGSRDSRGHNSCLQSRDERELVSYDDI